MRHIPAVSSTLARAWDAKVGDGDALSPIAVRFLTTGIPKLIRLERTVGISTTHADVIQSFER